MLQGRSHYHNYRDCTNLQFEYLKYLEDNRVHENIIRVLREIKNENIPEEIQKRYFQDQIVPKNEEQKKEEEELIKYNSDLKVEIQSLGNTLLWKKENCRKEVYDCEVTHSIPKLKVKNFDMENIDLEHPDFTEVKKISKIEIKFSTESIEFVSTKKSFNISGVITKPAPSILSENPIIYKYQVEKKGMVYLYLERNDEGNITPTSCLMCLEEGVASGRKTGGRKSGRKKNKIGSIHRVTIGEKRIVEEPPPPEEEEEIEEVKKKKAESTRKNSIKKSGKKSKRRASKGGKRK